MFHHSMPDVEWSGMRLQSRSEENSPFPPAYYAVIVIEAFGCHRRMISWISVDRKFISEINS
jgi:hypothetical protein